jgi:hypothetical protein
MFRRLNICYLSLLGFTGPGQLKAPALLVGFTDKNQTGLRA